MFHGGIVNTARRASGRTRLALVAGIAVLASVTAPLAPASAATPPAKAGAENPAPVTVVQDGGSADVRIGEAPPSKVRFTATLPAGLTGDVKAQLAFNRYPGAGWDTPARMISGFGNVACS